MEMASFFIKIRHVFADTSLTERSIGAGPPVIIQLSDWSPGSGPTSYPGYYLRSPRASGQLGPGLWVREWPGSFPASFRNRSGE